MAEQKQKIQNLNPLDREAEAHDSLYFFGLFGVRRVLESRKRASGVKGKKGKREGMSGKLLGPAVVPWPSSDWNKRTYTGVSSASKMR